MDKETLEFIADDLHRIICQYNHFEECSYYDGLFNSERAGWIGRAERTVAQLATQGVTDPGTIVKVIHAVERVR